ncbi:MAG: hypothetical protein ACXAC7_14285 [Candidatus Hodarchaeales archaeon]|jgi:hypothetical protein
MSDFEKQTLIFDQEYKENNEKANWESSELIFAFISLLIYFINSFFIGLFIGLGISESGSDIKLDFFFFFVGILAIISWAITYFAFFRPRFYGKRVGDWFRGGSGGGEIIVIIIILLFTIPAFIIVVNLPFRDKRAEERIRQRKEREKRESERIKQIRTKELQRQVVIEEPQMEQPSIKLLEKCKYCKKPLSGREKSLGYHMDCYRVHY